jgi:small subunit ribosomal protein S16
MAVVIRMRRTGRKNRPCFRITVTDSRFPRDGRLVESLGFYDPLERKAERQIRFDVERARYWIGQGAQPSETVRSIFKRFQVFEGRPVRTPRRRPGRAKETAKRVARRKAKAQRAEGKAARRGARLAAKKAAAASGAETPAPA